MDVPDVVADTLLADAASLRRLARGLLAGADADDAVQDACVAALEHPAVLTHPGLWLRGTVRKLALMMRRGSARRLARERLVAKPELDRRDPAAIAVQAELVRDVGTAVHDLEEPFRTAVLLRYWHDLPVAAIAAQLGVPHNTVRSRLQRGLARLREQLDAEHGDRSRWALALGGFLPLRAPALAVFTLGLMNKKALVGAVAVLLAALSIPWLLQEAPAGPHAATPGSAALVAKAVAAASAGTTERRETVATPQPETATTGTLVVRVLHANEPKVGSGVTVSVARPFGDFRVGLLQAIADADGTARFTDVQPGKVRVRSNQPSVGASAEVRGGSITECTLQLQGFDVSGVVVDAAGTGIGGALLETSTGNQFEDAQVSAITAADGSFTVRDNVRGMQLLGGTGGTQLLIGARAAGFAASQMYWFEKIDPRTSIRIVLATPGGCVAGSVVTDDGAPVQGAVVRVGEGKTDSLFSTLQGAAPLPAQVRTDAAGRFLAVGVPAGTQPVSVRAAGLAPWSGTCDMFAGLTIGLDVRLHAGVTVIGVVRTEAAEPAQGVIVRCGRDGEFLQYFARTAADGAFTLQGLPTGESEVWIDERARGLDSRRVSDKARARVNGEAGATVRCDLDLSSGIALRGSVTGEDGKPLGSVDIECRAEVGGSRWFQPARTDAAGRFLVPDCPDGHLLQVTVLMRDFAPVRRQEVDPKAGELDIQLSRDQTPRVRITGHVLDVDGQPARDVNVHAVCIEREHRDNTSMQSADGTFAFEVPAATWEIRVDKHGHPTVFAGPREVQADAPWDTGALQLTRGGTLVVHDGGRKELTYLIFDAHEQFRAGLYTPVPPLRSDLLAPEEYLLLVRGAGIAATVLPFTIRSGQETELEVQPRAGVRQRFECVHAAGGELPYWLNFTVRRQGRLAGYCPLRRELAGPLAGEAWLEPGEYALATRDSKLQCSTSFTVGRAEGPIVRIAVR